DVEAVRGQADLVEDGADAGVEVVAADGEEVLERGAVGLDRGDVVGHGGGGLVEGPAGGGDAGATGQVGPQGLTGSGVRLLGQPAHGGGGRRPLHGAAVEGLGAGEGT